MFINFTIVFAILIHNFFVGYAPSNKNIIKRYNIHGIDVSHHQRNVDWEKIATHNDFKVSFCFLKATEGSTFQDTKFKTYWNECKEAGIARGAYHFYHPTRSAIEQAKNFIKSVKLSDGDLAPVLDFEKDSKSANVASVRKNLTKWLQTIEKHYGIKPIIYTNTSIYKKYIKGHFKDNPLWLADYNSSNIHSQVRNPNLKIWQYTEKGRVTGIPGHVDINAFVGAEDEFENLKIRN